MRILLLVVITIVVGDLNYTAAQDAHNESTCFLIEVESECDADEAIENLVPEIPFFFIEITVSQESAYDAVSNTEQQDASNLTPHGWHVPVFIDDCVYRL